MTYALIHGLLFKAPEQKTSGNGHKYVTATIKSRAADNRSEFWNVRAFNSAVQDELMRLTEGESLAVQGLMSASIYTPAGGEPRVSLSLMADNVLATKPKKESKVAAIKPPVSNSPKVVPLRKHDRPVIDDDLDDECPF